MAKYDVRHVCGHVQEHELFGPGPGRDRRRTGLATVPCRECRREDDWRRAVAYAEREELPALTGSDKQIAWAEVIRHETLVMIDRVVRSAVAEARRPGAPEIDPLALPVRVPPALKFSADEPDPTVGEVVDVLKRESRAHWWIEHAKDVSQAGRPIRLGRGATTEWGMLTEQAFVREIVRLAAGLRRPTTADLAKSNRPEDLPRAVTRGGS